MSARDPLPTVDYAAAWLVPQTCVRCGEQTMHDSRVCGRCAEKDVTCTCGTGCEGRSEGHASRLCEFCRYEDCVSVTPPADGGDQ